MYRAWVAVMWMNLLASPIVLADQVVLKNGDRLSGAIVKSDAKVLILKSEFAGDVNIQWDAIDSIQSTQPLYVGLKDGETIAGTITTTDGKLRVETRDAGAVTTSKDAILTVRSETEQAAYHAEADRLRNPRLTDFWSGYLDAGLSTTRGNSQVLNFALAAKAVRRTTRDVITVYASSIFANNGTAGPTVTTANAIGGGVRMDLNVTNRVFIFGFTDFLHDQFQRLDLRNVLGGGIGYHVVKTKATLFDVYGGGAYDQAFYSIPLTRRDGEILAGESLSHAFNERTKFSERFEVFPNVSTVGEYRTTFDANVNSKLYRWLSWQISFNDGYVSNPPGGVKKNDMVLSTGLHLIFGRTAQ